MNVRIQTYGMGPSLVTVNDCAEEEMSLPYMAEGTTVYDALEKGFDDLADLCDVVTEKFTEARDAFVARQHE